jgi:ribosomal protein S18 acetylase RimI-like enzyme
MMLTAENASMAAPALCTANGDILPDSAACSNIHSTITSSPAKDFNSCNDNFLYETCFSDDEQDFLLYRGEEDEPCAVCSLDYENGFTNLYGVYVDEDCRGQGIGTLLLTHLIPAYFKNHNLPLILNVRSTNTAAMQLYRHCGFEITSSVEFSYFTALPQ